MAGNDWINSYLEAILDVGPGIDDAKSSLLLSERGRFSSTRYFVEEVVSGFDESDLYRSSVKSAPHARKTECGYYVMRYMNEIITRSDLKRTVNEHFNNMMPYSQEDIDEVRGLLADYFLNN